ncbi:hypothetical protein F4555_000691 [Mobiluncus mulieris]|nr:hypothetical protein [Mobiluncus mulieris]
MSSAAAKRADFRMAPHAAGREVTSATAQWDKIII